MKSLNQKKKRSFFDILVFIFFWYFTANYDILR